MLAAQPNLPSDVSQTNDQPHAAEGPVDTFRASAAARCSRANARESHCAGGDGEIRRGPPGQLRCCVPEACSRTPGRRAPGWQPRTPRCRSGGAPALNSDRLEATRVHAGLHIEPWIPRPSHQASASRSAPVVTAHTTYTGTPLCMHIQGSSGPQNRPSKHRVSGFEVQCSAGQSSFTRVPDREVPKDKTGTRKVFGRRWRQCQDAQLV